MADRTCSVEGCERKHYGRGYCQTHYWRWRTYGTVDLPERRPRPRPAPRQCSIDGCERNQSARGWCKMHYERWLSRGGDPAIERHIFGDPERSFWAKVSKTQTCWLWTGGTGHLGYGVFWNGTRLIGAHRFAYEQAHGAIPEGQCIDHVCHTPACVNPDHLRATTPKQNAENKGRLLSNNTSGAQGVTWDKNRHLWVAQVQHNGKHVYAGRYRHLGEAAEAARLKRLELFTHNDLDRTNA